MFTAYRPWNDLQEAIILQRVYDWNSVVFCTDYILRGCVF